jgi:Zn-dependent peptidase ImmA (M78 family)/DNA-binding XRE family transcriptional regulator
MTGERFKLAREINGLTQKELLRRIDELAGRRVSQSAIAEIESGRLNPSSELSTAIGDVTGFPIAFFEQGELPEFPSGSLVLYRAKAAVTAKEEAQVRRHAQLLTEIVSRIGRRVNPIPNRIPQLQDSPPEEAARLTRAALGSSPDRPIENLVRAIERAGVLMLALPIRRELIDAFSVWVGRHDHTCCIALLSNSPPDRQRFSVAHELGHLVLHRTIRGTTAGMEREADQFAAELLTPFDAMEAEIIPPVTLVSLRDLKARWRVSMRSLINRAHEVNAISARQRGYLFAKMNATFGGKRETTLFLPERPRALRQMFEMVYGLPIDFEAAAFDLSLDAGRLRMILEEYQGGDRPFSEPDARVLQFRKA